MTPFRFTLQKKIQAACVVLNGRDPMDVLRLLKLLYIADREALQERGCPIVGGHTVAMNHGPLHSEIYDLIKGSYFKSPEWQKFIKGNRQTLSMVAAPGIEQLSTYEIEKLNEVTERYSQMDTWSLSELTHTFEEWIKNFHENNSTPIPTTDLLHAVGLPEDAIEHVLKNANMHSYLMQKMS